MFTIYFKTIPSVQWIAFRWYHRGIQPNCWRSPEFQDYWHSSSFSLDLYAYIRDSVRHPIFHERLCCCPLEHNVLYNLENEQSNKENANSRMEEVQKKRQTKIISFSDSDTGLDMTIIKHVLYRPRYTWCAVWAVFKNVAVDIQFSVQLYYWYSRSKGATPFYVTSHESRRVWYISPEMSIR